MPSSAPRPTRASTRPPPSRSPRASRSSTSRASGCSSERGAPAPRAARALSRDLLAMRQRLHLAGMLDRVAGAFVVGEDLEALFLVVGDRGEGLVRVGHAVRVAGDGAAHALELEPVAQELALRGKAAPDRLRPEGEEALDGQARAAVRA